MAVDQLAEKRKERGLVAKSSKSDNPVVNLVNSTLRESAVDPDSLRNPWNIDDLYIKRNDYSIYEDMVKDDQVSVALNIKKDLIIGSGYQFICEDEDTEEIREDLEIAFNEDLECSFEDCLMEIMTGYEFGFSVTEKQFKTREDGSLTLNKLKTRHPVSWLFHQDEFGKVIRYEQQGTSEKFSNIDPNSLIHFINNPKFENPYGTSDLRAAYTAYFVKQQIIRYYAIFMEKAASPIPVAKYDKNLAEDDDIQAIHDTIKKFQASTALTIPKEFEIEFIDAKGDGSVYINGINLFNMFIGRSLFVPDLLGFQGGETRGGSQALGQEQMQVFFKHIFRRRKALEKLINNHLVKPIVRWNFGDVDKYPKFKFKPIDEDIAEKNARLWLEAIRSPSYKVTDEDINHFKKIIEFPESEFDEEEIDPIEEEAAKEIEPVEEEEKKEIEKEEVEQEKDKFAKEVAKNVDIKSISTLLDSSLDLFNAKSKPILDEIFSGLSKELNKSNKNPKLRKSSFNKLKKLLNESMADVWKKSADIAQTEIFKLNFAIQTSKEFIKTLESENLAAVGDWEYVVNKNARIAIIEAIKDGKPIPDVAGFITETQEDIANRVDRYARTKFTEVMNKARRDWFESTGVVVGYQYSAILDGRTTEICEKLNGKKFKAENAPIPPLHFNCRSLLIPITKFEEFQPDKTVEVEVKQKDGGFKTVNRNIDKFIEKEKGKGFAKQ